ncbi:MAG: sensor domain-containing diguanylate cyclase [Armatimonadetes bacterium]|nr:sensor domain-containing diguanylate cyclase [Armatimonadota bacterium]
MTRDNSSSHWSRVQEQLSETIASLHAGVESLEFASRQFEMLFRGLPVGSFTFDINGTILQWNSSATTMFGIDADMAVNNRIWDIFDQTQGNPWTQDKIARLSKSAKSIEFDWRFAKPDGSDVHLACTVVGLTAKNGKFVSAVACNLDISARVMAQLQLEEQMRENRNYLKVMERQRLKLQEANRQLRRMAITDGITTLTNRRRFNELLEEVLDSAIRQQHAFSVLMIDIDHFKSHNDEFGHLASDRVLNSFGEVLRETSRRYERPARFGGEEFTIILDNCDKLCSIDAANRFRNAINSFQWPYRQITASIGCSTFSGKETPEELVDKADKAMYASKRAGRDTITHYDDLNRATSKVAGTK